MDRLPEPAVAPDWAHAPRRITPVTVAPGFDRRFGAAVHAGLARWQRGVDGGASRRTSELIAAVRRQAESAGLPADDVDRFVHRLQPGLRAYAEGPWPRRATLFLEQSVRHTLTAADGFALDLHLRVDRVVRFRRSVAILDFKTVTPHAAEMRADEWQLRTYALAAPDLLGVAPASVHLYVVDLLAAVDHEVSADRAALDGAAGELLAEGRKIAAANFALGPENADRPCWSCGYRLQCPSSLAPTPPRA